MSLKLGTAVTPNATAIDVKATTNIFSMTINGGLCYGYNLFIADSTGTTQFNSNVVSLASNPVRDGNTLNMEHDISSLDYGETYSWYVRLYTNSAVTEYITNTTYTFYADTPPTLDYYVTPSGTSPSKYYSVSGAIYSVEGTYIQAENVGLKSWYYSIYDSSQALIAQYSATYDNDITQEFSNLLTGRTYWIEFTVQTLHGFTETSERIQLIVSYENVPSTITPTAENSYLTSGITITWNGLVYILGTTGTSPTYYESGGYYYILPNADIIFDGFVAVSEFNAMIDWGNVATTFNGDIAVLENTITSETLTVTYNNAGTQMELYYGASLIDTVTFADPTVAPGRWLIFVDWDAIGLQNATLKITAGV